MTKLTDAQRRVLLAVKYGRVRHQHVFTWVLQPCDFGIAHRSLAAAARNRLIRVVATSPETQRPVELTARGRSVLEEASDG